eukprot:GHVH01006525.1.p1 GENE.GHVH01006525.1~~GHVH01006525.1.p1  ORF type:complete len:321 (+),score=36.81 GHVH01006525.1:70-1032(+)
MYNCVNLVKKNIPSASKTTTLHSQRVSPNPVIEKSLKNGSLLNSKGTLEALMKYPMDVDKVLTGNFPAPKVNSFYHNGSSKEMDNRERFSMKVFAIPSAKKLTDEICQALDIEQGRLRCKSFADGECSVTIHDDVNKQSCYLVAASPPGITGSAEVHKVVMETLFTLSAMKRAGASDVTVLFPYFPYFRHHNKGSPDKAVANGCADVPRLLNALGAGRVVLFDVHIPQVDAYFEDRLPVTNLNANDIIAEHIQGKYGKELDGDELVVCATSNDGGFKAKLVASRLRAHGIKTSIAVSLGGMGRMNRSKMSGMDRLTCCVL